MHAIATSSQRLAARQPSTAARTGPCPRCSSRTQFPSTRACITPAASHARAIASLGPLSRRSLGCQSRLRHRSLNLAAHAANEEAPAALVAMEGDIVTINFTCKGPDGEVLETTEGADPITFEVGAGEVMGNALFQALDGAVRGLSVGDQAIIEAQGGEWQRDLLFTVPREHPEVERLEGRYKNQGGLREGLVVELANGGMALVVSSTEAEVVLDANNMMAGKTLSFELQLVSVDRQ